MLVLKTADPSTALESATADAASALLVATTTPWALRPTALNDRLLRDAFSAVLSASKDCPPEERLIMYDANDLPAELSAPLAIGVRKRLDPRRNTKPKKPDAQLLVCTPFDPDGFNFSKIRNPGEVMLELDLNGAVYRVLTNKFPLFANHMLLVAESLVPQQMTLPHLRSLVELLQATTFCAYFNSWCASASVNHFHCHLIDEPPPVTELPLTPGPLVDGVRCLIPVGLPWLLLRLHRPSTWGSSASLPSHAGREPAPQLTRHAAVHLRLAKAAHPAEPIVRALPGDSRRPRAHRLVDRLSAIHLREPQRGEHRRARTHQHGAAASRVLHRETAPGSGLDDAALTSTSTSAAAPDATEAPQRSLPSHSSWVASLSRVSRPTTRQSPGGQSHCPSRSTSGSSPPCYHGAPLRRPLSGRGADAGATPARGRANSRWSGPFCPTQHSKETPDDGASQRGKHGLQGQSNHVWA